MLARLIVLITSQYIQNIESLCCTILKLTCFMLNISELKKNKKPLGKTTTTTKMFAPNHMNNKKVRMLSQF